MLSVRCPVASRELAEMIREGMLRLSCTRPTVVGVTACRASGCDGASGGGESQDAPRPEFSCPANDVPGARTYGPHNRRYRFKRTQTLEESGSQCMASWPRFCSLVHSSLKKAASVASMAMAKQLPTSKHTTSLQTNERPSRNPMTGCARNHWRVAVCHNWPNSSVNVSISVKAASHRRLARGNANRPMKKNMIGHSVSPAYVARNPDHVARSAPARCERASKPMGITSRTTSAADSRVRSTRGVAMECLGRQGRPPMQATQWVKPVGCRS